ncbi:nephrocystin-1 [Nephila pilipes]|uniref:Nephrocystin-1 n=1 Tax=Nephila pilipes TaxID=299642 RepID=A0A8X6PX53_NEPPI|nr:nephrocystin-1 [Nephila pilipes]
MPNATLLQKKINLIAARQIPEPHNDFIVKSRHVRMCFHDGNKISAKDSCSKDGEIFIKCNKCVPTLDW